ncbi:hypothetical protein [Chryseobacterium indoltheticum]|uniref:hypothetical protein n=1 Tax=Chryseobacterium indoltheticum TaxID=254 RepID=UPI003F4975A5
MLEILYRDEHLIAINKPSGLLVHKSFYSGEADTYAIQELKADRTKSLSGASIRPKNVGCFIVYVR